MPIYIKFYIIKNRIANNYKRNINEKNKRQEKSVEVN